MSEIQANTAVVKPTAEEIIATVRAGALKKKDQAIPSGKSTETGAEAVTGRSIASYANEVGRRANLLIAELKDLDTSSPARYSESMRRFDKLQSAAGLLNICISNSNGLPKSFIHSRNFYSEIRPETGEASLIDNMKNKFWQEVQGNGYSNTQLEKLDGKLAFLQDQALGETIKQELQDIRSQVEEFAKIMHDPKSLAEFTTVEIRDGDRRDSDMNLADNFRRFACANSGYGSSVNILFVEANPYCCVQKDPEIRKQEFKSILRDSWTLSKKITALSCGHTAMPAVTKGVQDLEKAVLSILHTSDRLLHRELNQIQAAKN